MEGWRSSKNMRGIVVENVTVRKPRERNPISILPSHYPSEHWLLFRRIDQYRSAHDSCRQFPKRIAKWSRRHAVLVPPVGVELPVFLFHCDLLETVLRFAFVFALCAL